MHQITTLIDAKEGVIFRCQRMNDALFRYTMLASNSSNGGSGSSRRRVGIASLVVEVVSG